MKLPGFLERDAGKIISEGMDAIGRARLTHYAALGPERTRSPASIKPRFRASGNYSKARTVCRQDSDNRMGQEVIP
jgi:hypothetical protein